jgi:hypothetical protein
MTANTQHQPRRRGRGRPFLPGQSGNPSGRPRVEGEIRELARARGAEAIATLVTLMRTGIDKIRLEAAQALLDRGYGRAASAAGGPLVNIDLRQQQGGGALSPAMTPGEVYRWLCGHPEASPGDLQTVREIARLPAPAAIEREPVADAVLVEIAAPARSGEAGEV